MDKLAISVRDMAMRMGISLPKAYALVRMPGFPSIRVGARIIIPVAAVEEWLRNTANTVVKNDGPHAE